MNLPQLLESSKEAGKLPADDSRVTYMGPDKGPFNCDHCEYFKGSGKPCAKVSNPVEAGGCCNLFQKG